MYSLKRIMHECIFYAAVQKIRRKSKGYFLTPQCSRKDSTTLLDAAGFAARRSLKFKAGNGEFSTRGDFVLAARFLWRFDLRWKLSSLETRVRPPSSTSSSTSRTDCSSHLRPLFEQKICPKSVDEILKNFLNGHPSITRFDATSMQLDRAKCISRNLIEGKRTLSATDRWNSITDISKFA